MPTLAIMSLSERWSSSSCSPIPTDCTVIQIYYHTVTRGLRWCSRACNRICGHVERRSAIIEDNRISDLEDRVSGVRYGPVSHYHHQSSDSTAFSFHSCCLSKTFRLKSLSACRDETPIILRRLSFWRSEWYDPDSTLSQSIVGITAPVDFSIRLKYIFTHIQVHVRVVVASCWSFWTSLPPFMMHLLYVRRHKMYIRRRGILLVLHFEPWPDFLEGTLILDQVSGCEPMKLWINDSKVKCKTSTKRVEGKLVKRG